MKILVTGGAGFIGTNLVKHILTNYPRYNILVADNFSSSNKKHFRELFQGKNILFNEGDISSVKFVQRVVSNFQADIVINCVDPQDDPSAIKSITLGNYILLETIRKRNPNLKKYIFISSDQVYGNGITLEGRIAHGLESDALKPFSITASAQASADLISSAYYNQYQIPTTILRPANLFGPHQSIKRLIPKLIIKAINNEDIPISNNGNDLKNWLYINDLIVLLDKLIHSDTKNTDGRTFNISGDLEISILETAELILTLLNKPKELITFVDDQTTDFSPPTLDSNLARSTFGWYPGSDLKAALKDTIEWFKEQLK